LPGLPLTFDGTCAQTRTQTPRSWLRLPRILRMVRTPLGSRGHCRRPQWPGKEGRNEEHRETHELLRHGHDPKLAHQRAATRLDAQFDNLDQIPRELLAFIEPTSLQAKIGEFLRPGAGAGVGSPLFMWAPITSSQCLREGTWHAFEVLIGQRPGVAIPVAVNEAECPLHAVTRTALGLFSEKRASRRRPDQAETDGAPGLSGL
jgi:hypothetical protein